MGFKLTNQDVANVFASWMQEYDIFAPKRFVGKGIYSDTDCIRYDYITSIDEVVFDEKSEFSFKEALIKNSETLFYFTEDEVSVPTNKKKGTIIFLRSCDLHAITRLDDIYLFNSVADFYYQRNRKDVKFVLMGCNTSFENCFCVSMKTNIHNEHDLAINKRDDHYQIDCKNQEWMSMFENISKIDMVVDHVDSNEIIVNVPEVVSKEIINHSLWDEYDTRCIACGRCTLVCPTCSCYTMQDIFYQENGKVGERKRVMSSCMIDGYSDMAGGHGFRKEKSKRMRYKVLHKVSDFKKRFNKHMCIGCGRCDDICPEYISFSNTINKISKAEEKESE